MMISRLKQSLKFLTSNLRIRAALGVSLPILLLLTAWSVLHYWGERNMLEEQIQLSSLQVSETLSGSLYHAMLLDDHEMIAQIVNDVGAMEHIQRVQLLDANRQVKADSLGRDVGAIRRFDDPGCKECHQYTPETRPQTARLILSPRTLRITIPINNEAECTSCHSEEATHLGVLLTDISFNNMEAGLLITLRRELLLSLTTMALVLLGIYWLMHNLVVRRMLSFRAPLARLATGDFSTRIPVSADAPDELDNFANTLNQMAEQLEHHIQQEKKLNELRRQAIAEERGRMARDLHDGLAQLLAYVNTKAMAVRIMLKNNQMEAADRTLLQLEEAARGLFAEVQDAIATLKTSSVQKDVRLCAALQDCVAQFSRLNDIPIELNFDSAAEAVFLSAETRQELFRIAQEALTNVRKHASATNVWMRLQKQGHHLVLSISDNGIGFDPHRVAAGEKTHLGLGTMRERAEEIGAEFNLTSKTGAGTHITVRLPIQE